MSEDDIKKNNNIDSFSIGNIKIIVNKTKPEDIVRRESLAPPNAPSLTWDEYVKCPVGQLPVLARTPVSKTSSKHIKVSIAMSKEFPMKVEMLLAVLEVIAPVAHFKHFNKLRDFVNSKLPPGFPIQVNIPVLPTVSAKVTFTDFKMIQGDEKFEVETFKIPEDYKLDPCRFPDL